MFMKKDNPNKQKLEASILEVLEQMALTDPDTEKYEVLTKRLSELYAIQNDDKKSSDKISKDTMLVAAANLAGILTIVNYEKLNVVTSKAFQLLLKVK